MGVFEDLLAATDTLRADGLWRDLFAENLFWASNEWFLQGSLLGAFNRVSEQYVADRERRLEGVQPDLLVMHRHDFDRWWSVREGQIERVALAGMCRALVQLKVAWAAGNAKGSAVPTQKAKAVATDIQRLSEYVADLALCEGYMAVLLVSCHELGSGPQRLDTVENVILATPSSRLRCKHRTELLTDHAAPSCRLTGPTFVASARLVWISTR